MFSSYNANVSRKYEEPSGLMDFKSAQTNLFWREMKIILQCMLKFNTLKSRHDPEMLALSRSVTFLMGLAAHKDYNSTWYYNSSKNPLRPLMFRKVPFRLSTRTRENSFFKKFTSGERFRKVPLSLIVFIGYVWTEAVFVKKKLRFQMKTDTCVQDLSHSETVLTKPRGLAFAYYSGNLKKIKDCSQSWLHRRISTC